MENNVEQQPLIFFESCLRRIEIIARSKSLVKIESGVVKLSPATADFGQFILRQVLPVQIDVLASFCHCRCSDWSRVFILYDESYFRESDILVSLKEQVSHCRFEGFIVIGLTSSNVKQNNEEGPHHGGLPPGVHYNTLIKDSIFEPGSRVYNNTTIELTHVACYGSVIRCGSFSRTQKSHSHDSSSSTISYFNFASSLSIDVGPETGGSRSIVAFPEMTLVDAARDLCLSSSVITSPLLPYDRAQMLASHCPLNIVSSYSTIKNVVSVKDVFLLPYSCIIGSSFAHNVTLLSHAVVEGGTIEHSQLQWDAKATFAHVTNSMLMEHSNADKSSKVVSSILGPDSDCSGGEVQYSILGPHVNSHHQSLIMATVWIAGRGNVGYGANVGSNHTGRVADQECWAGEGTFWGLSNVVKFPTNLCDSPYSIVAAGVQFLSQRVCMPFSLFTDSISSTTSGDGSTVISTGNQCFPGWLLLHSAYTIARSEHKFSTRTKAKRHRYYTSWKIVRPGIVDLCVRARHALQRVNSNNGRPIYFSDTDIDGLGKCHLTEAARLEGIKSYTDFIQRYALRGLFEKLSVAHRLLLCQSGSPHSVNLSLQDSSDYVTENRAGRVQAPVLPWEEKSYQNSDELWKHQISILRHEFPIIFSLGAPLTVYLQSIPKSLETLLAHLVELETHFSNAVEQSKKKDDIRGAKIIPGYANVHAKAEDDKVVLMAKKEARDLAEAVRAMLQVNERPWLSRI